MERGAIIAKEQVKSSQEPDGLPDGEATGKFGHPRIIHLRQDGLVIVPILFAANQAEGGRRSEP